MPGHKSEAIEIGARGSDMAAPFPHQFDVAAEREGGGGIDRDG